MNPDTIRYQTDQTNCRDSKISVHIKFKAEDKLTRRKKIAFLNKGTTIFVQDVVSWSNKSNTNGKYFFFSEIFLLSPSFHFSSEFFMAVEFHGPCRSIGLILRIRPNSQACSSAWAELMHLVGPMTPISRTRSSLSQIPFHSRIGSDMGWIQLFINI